jgi:thymidine kinase
MQITALSKECYMSNTEGVIEVITGTMFSGKTEELLRRIKRVEIGRQHFIIFKPSTDTRSGEGFVKSNGGPAREAMEVPVKEPHKLALSLIEWEREHEHEKCDVIALDEAQFFPRGSQVVKVISNWARQGRRVIVAGLDLDFRGEPFGAMPEILAIADEVTKLTAVCKCGRHRARFPQRMIDGEVAPFDGAPQVLVGGMESYVARCRECFVFPGTLERRRSAVLSSSAT